MARLVLALSAVLRAFEMHAAGSIHVFVQSVRWDSDYAVEGIERGVGIVVGFSDDGQVVEFSGNLVRTKGTRVITLEPNSGYVLKAGRWRQAGRTVTATMGVCKVSRAVKVKTGTPAQDKSSVEWLIAGGRLATANKLRKRGAEFTAVHDAGLETTVRAYLDECK